MARTTQHDLTGAVFSKPWFATGRTAKGLRQAKVKATLPDGRVIQVSRTGRDDAEAWDALQAVIERPYGARPGKRETLDDVWERWWTETSTTVRLAADGSRLRNGRPWADSTRVRYRSTWHRHIADDLGDRVPASITRAELRQWLLQPRSCQPKQVLDTLRVVFRQAVDDGLITDDPTKGGFRLPTGRPEAHPVSIDDLDRIEEHLRGLKPFRRRVDPLLLHDVWVLLRSTGARLSELLALRARDYDPRRRTLRIGDRHIAKVTAPEGSRHASTLAVVEGTKTQRGARTITVGKAAGEMLTSRIGDRPRDVFIFARADGRWHSTNSISNGLNRELSRIGIAATAHDLRDTVASAIAEKLVRERGYAAGMAAAARYLGHTSTKSLPHYVDSSNVVEDLSDIVDDLDPVATRSRRIEEAVDEVVAEVGVSAYLDLDDEGVTQVHVGGADAHRLGYIRGVLGARFGDRVRVLELNDLDEAVG